MTIDKKRYPDKWKELALSVKEAAGWRCQCCNRSYYKPGERPEGITRSEQAIKTLVTQVASYKVNKARKQVSMGEQTV